MSDVTFQEEPSYSTYSSVPENTGISGWLISHKLASTSAQANLYLLAVTIFAIVVAVVVFAVSSFSSSGSPDPRAVQWMKEGHTGPIPANFK